MKTKLLSIALGTALSLGGLAAPAIAQDDYPSRPVNLVVPNPAGGGTDFVARVLAEKVGEIIGQNVIVSNRGGGSSVIGTQYVIGTAPDGYTLVAINPQGLVVTLLQEVPYDFMNDLTPIIKVGEFPQILVVPGNSGIETIKDLAEKAISDTGVSFGFAGYGSNGHISGTKLTAELGGNSTGIAYKGTGDALQGVMGGHVDMLITSTEAIEAADAGYLKVLAVTSRERLPSLPDIPTMIELGFEDFTATTWFMYSAPAGTPDAVIDKLASAFQEAMQDTDVRKTLEDAKLTIDIATGEDLAQFVQSEQARWKAIIEENDITLE